MQLKDGHPETIARARTMRKATEKIIDLARSAAPIARLAVMHTHFPEGAEGIRAALGDLAPAETILIDVGAATGVQVGPGALGVALLRER
ncbi:MAG TPA: DegV family protein [Aggregatilineales bacterium]|nr:DegV family protein [Aggregatilineales bacterium]